MVPEFSERLVLSVVSLHYIFNRILDDPLRKNLNLWIKHSFLDINLIYCIMLRIHITYKFRDIQSLGY